MAQTDNSFLTDKVMLRVGQLPEKQKISVLDGFGGHGVVWRNVERISKKQIGRLPIDLRDDVGFHLPGNNLAFLPQLDLSGFDVVDLDAYGVPAEQIKFVLSSSFRGVLFITFIQSIYGKMPKLILRDLGFTDDMIEKAPTMFVKHGWRFFLDWLALFGVRRIVHRSHARKHYLAINCGAESSAGCDTRSGGSIANPS